MVSWKLGLTVVGGGADISTLAVPRQQSNIRMTWVATGTPCKETGEQVKYSLASHLTQNLDEFVLEESLIVVVNDNVPAYADAARCPGELEGVLVLLLGPAFEGTLTWNNAGAIDHNKPAPTSMATEVEEQSIHISLPHDILLPSLQLSLNLLKGLIEVFCRLESVFLDGFLDQVC